MGQLGRDDVPSSRVPTVAAGVLGQALAVGRDHACVIASPDDGGVRCWGDNSAGQLTGRAGDGFSIAEAVALEEYASCDDATDLKTCTQCGPDGRVHACAFACGEDGVCVQPTSVAVGGQACAILQDGQVWCWSAERPSRIALADRATGVAVGAGHSCAVLEDGGVRCWGDNAAGQLGVPPGEPRVGPERVVGVPLSGSVAVGGDSSCAVSAGGEVFCWGAFLDGRNHGAQIPAQEVPHVPRQIVGIAGRVQQVVVGSRGTACARVERTDAGAIASSVACWGWRHGFGESSGSPEAVPGLPTDRRALGLAESHGTFCALMASDGAAASLWCWGSNADRAAGVPAGGAVPAPVDITANYGADAAIAVIAGGDRVVCAVMADSGEVWCHGGNGAGLLDARGDEALRRTPTPVAIPGLCGVTDLDVGAEGACALTDAGWVRCWGGLAGDGVTPPWVRWQAGFVGLDAGPGPW